MPSRPSEPLAAPAAAALQRLPAVDDAPRRPASSDAGPDAGSDAGTRGTFSVLVRPLPSPPASNSEPRPEAPEAARRDAERAAALEGVRVRAASLVAGGIELAERRAYYSARAEFIQALELLAQAHDRLDGSHRAQQLARGLRALDEADDFLPRGSRRLGADLPVERVVVSHRTNVLQQQAAQATPLDAVQQYYAYAQQQLAAAAADEPIGSAALHHLGKLHTVMVDSPAGGGERRAPKAMALQQAALVVDASNVLAANELGVLLARYGQLDAAREAFQHAVSIAPLPEAWHNLAEVHRRQGRADAAHHARQQYERLAQRRPAGAATPGVSIEWVEPDRFVNMANNDPGAREAFRAPRGPAR